MASSEPSAKELANKVDVCYDGLINQPEGNRMPSLRKSAIEQIKLESRAEAFKLAAEFVDGPKLGQTPAEHIHMMERISAQNLENHIRIHGEYIP
jgi:hypothetical protein